MTTMATFEAYLLCIRRGLAMHASLMRVGVRIAAQLWSSGLLLEMQARKAAT
jgi:hypothetical protein